MCVSFAERKRNESPPKRKQKRAKFKIFNIMLSKYTLLLHQFQLKNVYHVNVTYISTENIFSLIHSHFAKCATVNIMLISSDVSQLVGVSLNSIFSCKSSNSSRCLHFMIGKFKLFCVLNASGIVIILLVIKQFFKIFRR